MFVVPTASEGYKEFTHKYLRRNKQDREVTDVYNQISDNEFLFVSSFDATNKVGYNFSLEHFEGTELKYRFLLEVFVGNLKIVLIVDQLCQTDHWS